MSVGYLHRDVQRDLSKFFKRNRNFRHGRLESSLGAQEEPGQTKKQHGEGKGSARRSGTQKTRGRSKRVRSILLREKFFERAFLKPGVQFGIFLAEVSKGISGHVEEGIVETAQGPVGLIRIVDQLSGLYVASQTAHRHEGKVTLLPGMVLWARLAQVNDHGVIEHVAHSTRLGSILERGGQFGDLLDLIFPDLIPQAISQRLALFLVAQIIPAAGGSRLAHVTDPVDREFMIQTGVR